MHKALLHSRNVYNLNRFIPNYKTNLKAIFDNGVVFRNNHENLLLLQISSIHYSKIITEFASELVEIPKTVEDLKKLNHEQVLTLVVEHLQIPSAIDTIEKPLHPLTNRFPPNALNGYHLWNAMEAFERNLRSGGTEKTATQDMVENLMEEQKIESKSVAESIANWIQHTYKEEPKTLHYFFEKIVQKDSNLTKTTIQTVVDNSSKVLLSSFGYNFHFVGRKESIEQIDAWLSTYTEKIIKKERLDKQDVSIPFIAAAPGVGKSKLLKQYGKLICSKGYFPLFVSFGNGYSLSMYEKSIDVETSLSIRFVYSFYRGLVSEDKLLDFDNFCDSWSNYFGSSTITIQSTLQFISTIVCNLFSTEFENQKVKFFVAIDEVHQIDGSKSEKTTNALQSIFSCIGTSYTTIYLKLLASTYVPQFIPVKAFLSNDEQIELIDALATKQNEIGTNSFPKLINWRTNSSFRYLLRTFGGFPRGIEFFLEYFLTDPTIDASHGWNLANDKLKQKYPILIDIEFINTIAMYIVTREVITKESAVINRHKTTWSDLENYGHVILQPVFASMAVAYYPPVLLDTFLQKFSIKNSHDESQNMLLITFRKAFLQNSDSYWHNWENIIHVYIYLIFSLLDSKPNITFKQLFPFAKMKSSTSETTLCQIISKSVMFESSIHLHNKISPQQQLTKLRVENDTIVKESELINILQTERVCIVKNGSDASAGDILVFGLKTQKKERIVIHYQCKWGDTQNGVVTYAQIESKLKKNQNLKISNTTVRNITVIICDTMIINLPNKLPTDLIIVSKENFSDFFGVLSYVMETSCNQFIRINEIDVRRLQYFVGESTASNIIEKRGSKGFVNSEDLKTKLDSNTYNYLTNGTIEKALIKEENSRTILF